MGQRKDDRTAIRPDRPLPDKYDEDYYHERDLAERESLISAYIRARGLGACATADEIRPLLVDLPVPVLRDILATNEHRSAGAEGTVGATFLRVAELLEIARVGSMRRHGAHDIRHPNELLTYIDIAFVDAVRAKVAHTGGELLLPPVPTLPAWANEHDRTMAATFEWLRVAIADTSGQKEHAPGCALCTFRPNS